MQLDKRWNFKDLEEKYKQEYKYWFGEGNRGIFVIDTPPPYPAPLWHIGAALSYVLQDFIARSKRKLGYKVVFPCGFDGNGLPIEFYLEKYEKVKFGSIPREEYLKLCRQKLDEWRAKMKEILRNLLISMDFDNQYNTDDPDYRAFTQLTFAKVWKKGLVYEGEYPVNYCPKCKTPIADAEIERKKVKGKLVYLKFKVKETGEDLIIATTRPELLAACKVVIVHPEDERYKHLHYKTAIVPYYNTEVKIIPHKAANPEFGTGAVMICSFGDWVDVQIFRELGLEPVKIIDEDGRLLVEPVKGLKTKEARERIIEFLKEKGYVVKVEEIEHDVPVHERCETEIEIIPMKEYYLKQVEFKEDMKKLANELKFYPERYRQNLINWIESVSIDWPISRRRWYATEIPVWKCEKCGYIYVPEDGKYHQPWKEEMTCPKCGAKMKGEERVFDTWMDSSVSILYVLNKYAKEFGFRDYEEFLRKAITLRPQGYDIIRTWLYYTLLRTYQLTGTKAFDEVVINGMGLDKHGRKMSKRYGNVIYPEEMIEKYGADTLRFWFAMEVQVGEDYRINEQKIAGIAKFFNKLWNVARYISQYPKPENFDESKLKPTDKWIVEEAKRLENFAIEAFEKYEFFRVARELYNFVWDKFANHYIELTKARARQGDESVYYALYYVLETILRILNVFAPATTNYLYRIFFGEDADSKPLEYKGKVNYNILWKGEKLMEFNNLVWKTKAEKGIKLKDPIGMNIPKELEEFKEDLVALHKLE